MGIFTVMREKKFGSECGKEQVHFGIEERVAPQSPDGSLNKLLDQLVFKLGRVFGQSCFCDNGDP